MSVTNVLEILQKKVPEAVECQNLDVKFVRGTDPQIKVPSVRVGAVAGCLKEAGFDLLNFLTAVDYLKEERFELIYQFIKTSDPAFSVIVKTDLPRSGSPSLPSIVEFYAAADWQERETYDLFGITFVGHPNPRRILLWEGYPGWPLRKDYVHTLDKYDNGSEIGLP